MNSSNTIIKALQNWRNQDQADSIRLSRHEVVTLLNEIERKHFEPLLNQNSFYHMIGNETHDGDYEDCTICHSKEEWCCDMARKAHGVPPKRRLNKTTL